MEMCSPTDYEDVAFKFDLDPEAVKNALEEISVMFDQKWVR